VEEIVRGCERENRFGLEECAYLLLFGELPTKAQLAEWQAILGEYRRLPDGFKEKVIIRAASKDLMNAIARAVLTVAGGEMSAEITPEEGAALRISVPALNRAFDCAALDGRLLIDAALAGRL
jgi:citrate synthase